MIVGILLISFVFFTILGMNRMAAYLFATKLALFSYGLWPLDFIQEQPNVWRRNWHFILQWIKGINSPLRVLFISFNLLIFAVLGAILMVSDLATKAEMSPNVREKFEDVFVTFAKDLLPEYSKVSIAQTKNLKSAFCTYISFLDQNSFSKSSFYYIMATSNTLRLAFDRKASKADQKEEAE